MDKFSPGIKQALGLERENRQCLGCKGAGSIRNDWVGLGRGRSGGLGPVKATPMGDQESIPARWADGRRWGCM